MPKVSDGQLRLTGDLLARIFLGEIRTWNAPDLAALNPGIALPDTPIAIVVRSDGSGTTYNFADYLSKINPKWREQFGVKTSFQWPERFTAVKGSDGVVKAVKETPGAIGYVDFAYVKDHRLNAVQLQNLGGDFVAPSPKAFREALIHSEWLAEGTFVTTLTNKPGIGTWPITMGTFIAVPRVASQPERTERALKFFVWAFFRGDELVQASNFVRLPDRIQASAFKVISSVTDKEGHLIGMSLPRAASAPR